MSELPAIPQSKSRLFYRKLCDSSFYHFIKIIGGPSSGRDICPELYIPICQFATDKTKFRRAMGEPRYWLKTTVLTKWKSIWEYLQNPESRHLIASENERLAANMLHWIEKTLLTNRRLRLLYPDKLKLVDEDWIQKNRWSGSACDLPRNGVYSESTFTAIGVTGAAQSGHYTHIHIDDLVGRAAMESPLILQSVFRWFDNIEELLVEPDTSKPNASYIDIAGTHWGNGDLFCYIQEKYDYEWRLVPCQKDEDLLDTENIKWIQNPKVKQGESNWPEYKSTAHYDKMKANPEKAVIYWTQHMNNPQKASGMNKFDKDWIKFYHYEDRDGIKYIVCNDDKEEFRLSDIQKYGIIDPGGFAETKLIKRGSNNALVVGGQPSNSIKKFAFYTWAGKPKEPDDFAEEVFKAHKETLARTWRIETFGAADYIYRHLIGLRKKRGITMSISPLPKDVSKGVKDTDIQALIPPMANGEFYFHNTMKLLIGEIVNYPMGLTNDLLDCLAKLFKYFMTRTKRSEQKKKFDFDEISAKEGGKSAYTGY